VPFHPAELDPSKTGCLGNSRAIVEVNSHGFAMDAGSHLHPQWRRRLRPLGTLDPGHSLAAALACCLDDGYQFLVSVAVRANAGITESIGGSRLLDIQRSTATPFPGMLNFLGVFLVLGWGLFLFR
jgi:hypothetical protein